LYRVLDLFAGAGGMSLGFEQTQKYKVALAVENNEAAQETYLNNNPDVLLESDILSIQNFSDFNKKYGEFDVVIGGPPCQGFSNANRQKSSLINRNNNLVKKYIEVIEKTKPKAFVMENVKMIS
jgi:DNA (cytosine-5)-methyltransferase 1